MVLFHTQNDDNTTYYDVVGDVCGNNSYPELHVAGGEFDYNN